MFIHLTSVFGDVLLNRTKSFFFFWMGQSSLEHQLFHSGVLGKYVSRCDPHKEITLEAH